MRRIRRWFMQLRRAVRRGFGETVHAVVADSPENPQRGILYIVEEEGVPWCAVLECPCHCGDVIHLSLVEHDRPRWSIMIDDHDRPTLSPSINRVVGCRSHFFIRAGRVVPAHQAVARR